MKTTHLIMALALVALTACKVIDNPNGPRQKHGGKDIPETVMVSYHVRAGREAEFPALLDRAWKIYIHEHLVRSGPHVVVETSDGVGKTKFVEIFTWVSHDAPTKNIGSMQAIWGEEMAACEVRDGHNALEGGEVNLVVP